MLLDGMTVESIRADSTCIDSAAANAAAERLITSDNVHGIVGADCSGVTTSILTNVAVPNGMVMISPSATSPALSTAEDNDLFFRTAPSDARQGVVMSEVIMDRGFDTVAVTYTNNDYGQGLADSFAAAFEEMGGTVTLVAAHEDGRADYSAEVGALAAAGGDLLVVAGYVDQGGSGIIQAALDTGAFDTFVFPDGMVSAALVENFGSDIDGSFGQHPGTDSEGATIFEGMAEAAGFDGTSPFAKESYDAAALILLAMQAAGSTAPRRLRGACHGRRERAWRADPAGRTWPRAGTDRGRRGHRLCRSLGRGTHRRRRVRGQLPRDRDRGRRDRDSWLPLLRITPAGYTTARASARAVSVP
jgi:branched-chain amino acid transport system substrate-binding protein